MTDTDQIEAGVMNAFRGLVEAAEALDMRHTGTTHVRAGVKQGQRRLWLVSTAPACTASQAKTAYDER